jgi:sec-independent protein translocase protein TatC
MTNTSLNTPENQEMPFVQHLIELRERLLKTILAVVIIMLVLMPFANDLFTLLAQPLLRSLTDNTKMIAVAPASPFFTPLKLTMVLSIFLGMPVILYQFWAFVAPGLYKHEKRIAIPLLVASVILFYVGMLFAYYVVFPLVFAFMVGTTPEGAVMMPDISLYLDFILTIFFAFGVAFQVPVVTVVFVWMEVITPEWLASKRRHIIVAAFIVGMVLTPPDVLSQTLLAIPMWLLFEVGLVFSRFIKKPKVQGEPTGETPSYPLAPVTKMDTQVARTPGGEEK